MHNKQKKLVDMTIKHGQKWKNYKIPLYQDYYNLVDKTLY